MQDKAQGSAKEGAYFVYVTELCRFPQRSIARFFRGLKICVLSGAVRLRKIVQDKAQGSAKEGAYFVYVTELCRFPQRSIARFFRGLKIFYICSLDFLYTERVKLIYHMIWSDDNGCKKASIFRRGRMA